VSDARRLVDKLWSYCNVLRDDGVGTLEYTEQLTYLLFLKMAHERENRKLRPERIVPPEFSWQRLLDSDGDVLELTYTQILRAWRSNRACSARSSVRPRTGSRTPRSSSA
jgi:type I restriction enzyme M protein